MIKIFSASEFDEYTGANPVERRTWCRLGIIEEMRTGSGWAAFTQEQADKAKELKRQQKATCQELVHAR